MADIFISYSHQDKERIKPIEDGLRNLGVSVWWDRDLKTGGLWNEDIEKEVTEARAILVCWSQFSVQSRNVKTEASIALDQGTLVPCLLEPCKIPLHFHLCHAEDISGWDGSIGHPGWRKIIERISVILERPGLPHLLDAIATDDTRQLASWVQTFREDPYAVEFWSAFEKKQRRLFSEKMRAARLAVEEAAKQRDADLKARLTRCEQAFDGWIADIREASSYERPDPTAVIAALEAPVGSGIVLTLEAERDAANERASQLEAAHKAAVVDIEKLKERSSGPRHRWSLILAALLIGATAGVGSYRAFLHSGPAGAEPSRQLAEQLKVANTELREREQTIAGLRSSLDTTQQNAAAAEKDLEAKLLDAQQRLKTALSSSSTNVIALQSQLNAANALAARLGSEKDQLAAAGEAEAQARTKPLADANNRLEVANNRIADLERQLGTVQDAPGHSVEKAQTSASQKPGLSEEMVAPPSVNFRKRENEDIADNAMISKKGISLKQCGSLCIANNKCLGYTFNQWDNFCFIKSTISGLKQNPRTISFIRNDIPLPALVKFDVKKHDGKEFKTEGYKIFSSKDTDTCKNACEKDDNCFAFTFRKLVGKCHLIHTTNEEYQPNPDADSGTKGEY
jgi:hypothetical protein